MTKAKDLLHFAGSCDDLDIDKSQKDWKTMNNPFLDDRPLTDETLEELGFELVPMYPDSENTTWSHPEHRFEVLYIDGKIESVRLLYEGGIYKTVGKLKMLIEALKGE